MKLSLSYFFIFVANTALRVCGRTYVIFVGEVRLRIGIFLASKYY